MNSKELAKSRDDQVVMNVMIKNVIITKIRDNPSWEKIKLKYRRFMPATLKPVHVSFELHNVTTSFANAIRRTLLSECLVKCMTFNLSAYTSTNPYMLNDFVLNRLEFVPINQMTVTNDMIFKLSITNNIKTRLAHVNQRYDRVERDYGKLTDDENKQKEKDLKDAENPQSISVYSGDIKFHENSPKKLDRLPFNETFTLATLDEGTSIEISSISIIEGFGYNHSRHSLTHLASGVPLDQIPLDLHTGEGVPSGLANPQIHLIKFTTNGIMDPHQIITYACKSIEERLLFIRNLHDEFKTVNNEHILTLHGESYTIGNLLMRTICDNEHVEGVTTNPHLHVRAIDLKIKTDNDVRKIMDKTISFLINNLKKIVM